jgi:UDP-N-acetylglucosamine 1-carboxyvinyltransferase
VSRPGDKYVISGGKALSGCVRISGAKNAILPILAATILTEGECVIHEVPNLSDVAVMTEILKLLGVSVEVIEEGETGLITIKVCARKLNTFEVRPQLTRAMRSSIFLMGPLLGRLGRVRVAYPGGCAIGPRPIDWHLSGLAAMGANIVERFGYIDAETKGLRGKEIYLDFPSVGATENLMMAAVLAKGVTIIRNAAREPEIVDLQNFLNKLGARIKGAGLDTIRIEGVSALGSTEHTVIADRIEAGTFMAAAAITGGDVLISNVIMEHVDAVMAKLREMGVTFTEEADGLRVRGPERLRAADLKTLPYPGFPTDLQPQLMALMSVAEGTSIITETIYENRFRQAEELKRLGANIKTEGRTAVIKGTSSLFGAVVDAPALREGVALVLAGLVAEGTTIVEGVHHIDRGYEHLDTKLTALGADIRRNGHNGV